MNILITGGIGYIGSHITLELIKKGHDVIILDNTYYYEKIMQINNALKHYQVMKEIKGYYIWGISDKSLNFIFNEYKIDAVIHLASLKSISESIKNPLNYYKSNLETALSILDNMDKFNINKLVFSSSCSVYGDGINGKVDELSKINSIDLNNPYSKTKRMIEEILLDYSKYNQLFDIKSLRYFNPIGVDNSGIIKDELFEHSINSFNLFQSIIHNYKKRNKIKILGNNFETIDGTGVRDYVHISDLANIHVPIIEDYNPGYSVYNVGSGVGTSTQEIINIFNSYLPKLKYEFANARDGDIGNIFADITKIKNDYNFNPNLNLNEIIHNYLKSHDLV